jgi:hypothetical protein
MSRLPTPLQTHVATPDTSLAAGEHADGRDVHGVEKA